MTKPTEKPAPTSPEKGPEAAPGNQSGNQGDPILPILDELESTLWAGEAERRGGEAG